MTIEEKIDHVKKLLASEKNYDAPHFAALYFRDDPVVIAAGLNDLAWILSSTMQNVVKNDVLGLIEMLEKHIAKIKETQDV